MFLMSSDSKFNTVLSVSVSTVVNRRSHSNFDFFRFGSYLARLKLVGKMSAMGCYDS